MIYVGIDIAKLNYFASFISADGKILIEPFKFTNDYNGFYFLLSKLNPLDPHSIITDLESTAHYGDNPVYFLITRDYKVCVLNPIKTSTIRKNNATLKAYYDSKKAEGRSHYNALGHCAGKLVRVIWKMLTDEVEFNLD